MAARCGSKDVGTAGAEFSAGAAGPWPGAGIEAAMKPAICWIGESRVTGARCVAVERTSAFISTGRAATDGENCRAGVFSSSAPRESSVAPANCQSPISARRGAPLSLSSAASPSLALPTKDAGAAGTRGVGAFGPDGSGDAGTKTGTNAMASGLGAGTPCPESSAPRACCGALAGAWSFAEPDALAAPPAVCGRTAGFCAAPKSAPEGIGACNFNEAAAASLRIAAAASFAKSCGAPACLTSGGSVFGSDVEAGIRELADRVGSTLGAFEAARASDCGEVPTGLPLRLAEPAGFCSSRPSGRRSAGEAPPVPGGARDSDAANSPATSAKESGSIVLGDSRPVGGAAPRD